MNMLPSNSMTSTLSPHIPSKRPIYICIYIYTSMYIQMYIYIHAHVYYTYTNVYIYTCTCLYTDAYVYKYKFIYLYICIYTCVHIYIYINMLPLNSILSVLSLLSRTGDSDKNCKSQPQSHFIIAYLVNETCRCAQYLANPDLVQILESQLCAHCIQWN